MKQMGKLLSYLVTWLLVIGALYFLPHPAYATETCNGANLECQYNSDCGSPHTCSCSKWGVDLCSKTYVPPATNTPTPGGVGLTPTTAPSPGVGCGTKSDPQTYCESLNLCTGCSGACSVRCNISGNNSNCSTTCNNVQGCPSGVYNSWSTCNASNVPSSCWQIRYCSDNSANYQENCCGSVTGCASTCNSGNRTNTPTPTRTPTPWIKVNVKNKDGTWHTSSQICGVDCSGTSCTKKTAYCSTNDYNYTFPKFNSTNTRLGGRIALTDQSGRNLVVVGVTPSVSGFPENTCNGIGGYCYVWTETSWYTGGRTVNFIVATPTPTPFSCPSGFGVSCAGSGAQAKIVIADCKIFAKRPAKVPVFPKSRDPSTRSGQRFGPHYLTRLAYALPKFRGEHPGF